MIGQGNEEWYGVPPIERHLMSSLSHLSDAQELLSRDSDEETTARLDQAKVIIIEEMEKRRQRRPGA